MKFSTITGSTKGDKENNGEISNRGNMESKFRKCSHKRNE